MRLLLDTPVALWWLAADPRLSGTARHVLDTADDVVLSVASVWEIAIKQRFGKLRAAENVLDRLAEVGLRILPIAFDHAVAAANLPLHHRDPFDRLLVAQARAERLTLMTNDPRIAAYDVAHVAAS